MGKRVLIGLGVLALVLLAAGGGFFYGTSVGEARASAAQQQLFQQRFGGQGRQFFGGQAGPTFGQAGQEGQGQTGQPGQRGVGGGGGVPNSVWPTIRGANGIMGTIEAVEGDTLIVSTQDGTVRVQTTDTTLIEKYKAVEVGDLEIGERVMVAGSQSDDGSITARSIQSLRAFPTLESEQP